MKQRRTRSLQWVLVRRLILLQAAMLAIFIALCAAALWIANPTLLVDNEAAVAALKGAVDRNQDGRLTVRETQELKQFRESFPHVWYIIRDKTGQSVRSGAVPDIYTGMPGALLGAIDHATLELARDDLRDPRRGRLPRLARPLHRQHRVPGHRP